MVRGEFGVIELSFEEFLQNLRADDKIEVYTDGSCIGNPGPGGWGCVFMLQNKRTILSGSEKQTTNNRMELMAAMNAIKTLPKNVKIKVFTDSAYVKNGITSWIEGWKKNNWKTTAGKPVKNQDLWEEFSAAVKEKNAEFEWVKGHGDCLNNNNADFIARSAIVTSYMES